MRYAIRQWFSDGWYTLIFVLTIVACCVFVCAVSGIGFDDPVCLWPYTQ